MPNRGVVPGLVTPQPVGPDGQVLTADSTQTGGTKWASPAGGGGQGLPLGLAGAVAATRYVGGTTTGAPTIGTFATGDFVIDQSGAVYVCTASGTPGLWRGTLYDKGGAVYNVKAYGAKGDNATDDTAAFKAAITAAQPSHGTVFAGSGTYLLNLGAGGVVFDGVQLQGSGSSATILSVTVGPGAGLGSFIVQDSGGATSYPVFSGFTLKGPYAPVIGLKGNVGDGIRQQAPQGHARFWDVQVSGFDSGWVIANAGGHNYYDWCVATNNYYGVYILINQFDYFWTDCLINGNTWANFATPADQGFVGCRFSNVHGGFAPYSIYQEPTPNPQGTNKLFMQSCIFDYFHFEAVGNGAIYCAAPFNLNGQKNSCSDIKIRSVGYSKNNTYKIGTRVRTDGVLNATTTVTSATMSFAVADIGRGISGGTIPAGATIVSVTNPTTVIISAAATGSATGVTITLAAVDDNYTVVLPFVLGNIRIESGASQFAPQTVGTYRFKQSAGDSFEVIDNQTVIGNFTADNGALSTVYIGVGSSVLGAPSPSYEATTGGLIIDTSGQYIQWVGAGNRMTGITGVGILQDCVAVTMRDSGAGYATMAAISTASATFTGNLSGKSLAVGQSATAPALATSGTIATANIGVSRVAPAAAVTAVVLAAGTVAGQQVTVVNEAVAANTITFAAAGTSNVADGVGTALAGLTARSFTWDTVTALWYRSN